MICHIKMVKELFSGSRLRGSEISKFMKTGWIFFNLPNNDDTEDVEHYVDAQVWTGYSHFLRELGVTNEVECTLQMKFPAGY